MIVIIHEKSRIIGKLPFSIWKKTDTHAETRSDMLQSTGGNISIGET